MKYYRMYGGQALRIAFGIIITFLTLAGSAVAATPISSCGTTISSPGDYVLTANLSSSSTCIKITSSDVVLDGAGYTINGGKVVDSYGIYVNSGSFTQLTSVTVKNLKVTNWGYGIYYKNAPEGYISGNNANSNLIDGIKLEYTRSNKIIGNDASNNGNNGIDIISSTVDELTSNTANSNQHDGISIYRVSSDILTSNTANSNQHDGISLTETTSTTLTGNKVSNNGNTGIGSYRSIGNTIQ